VLLQIRCAWDFERFSPVFFPSRDFMHCPRAECRGLAASKVAALQINLNIDCCGVVAPSHSKFSPLSPSPLSNSFVIGPAVINSNAGNQIEGSVRVWSWRPWRSLWDTISHGRRSRFNAVTVCIATWYACDCAMATPASGQENGNKTPRPTRITHTDTNLHVLFD
jgi:hypothetical protein